VEFIQEPLNRAQHTRLLADKKEKIGKILVNKKTFVTLHRF